MYVGLALMEVSNHPYRGIMRYVPNYTGEWFISIGLRENRSKNIEGRRV